jgi:hypothetical protein
VAGDGSDNHGPARTEVAMIVVPAPLVATASPTGVEGASAIARYEDAELNHWTSIDRGRRRPCFGRPQDLAEPVGDGATAATSTSPMIDHTDTEV